MTTRNEMSERTEKYEKLYFQGLVDREIAAATGVKQARVCVWRNLNQLPPNSNFSKIDVKLFESLYYIGLYPKEISEKLGVEKKHLINWMHRHEYYYLCPAYQIRAYELYLCGCTDTEIAIEIGTQSSVIGTWRSDCILFQIRTHVDRLQEYLRLKKAGCTDNQIADEMGIDERAVERLETRARRIRWKIESYKIL